MEREIAPSLSTFRQKKSAESLGLTRGKFEHPLDLSFYAENGISKCLQLQAKKNRPETPLTGRFPRKESQQTQTSVNSNGLYHTASNPVKIRRPCRE